MGVLSSRPTRSSLSRHAISVRGRTAEGRFAPSRSDTLGNRERKRDREENEYEHPVAEYSSSSGRFIRSKPAVTPLTPDQSEKRGSAPAISSCHTAGWLSSQRGQAIISLPPPSPPRQLHFHSSSFNGYVEERLVVGLRVRVLEDPTRRIGSIPPSSLVPPLTDNVSDTFLTARSML